MSTLEDPVFTAEEAAPLMKAKPLRVRRLCASGRLAAKKDGTRWLIRKSAIDAYLRPDNTTDLVAGPEPRFETAAERRRARLAS